ncbi:MAG: DUF2793 domain-containing protein [Pseudomonadota bacterium]
MTETSLNLSMPYIQEGQAQKHVTHNEAVEILDAIVHLAVERMSDTPPETPSNGSRWVVGASPNGDWADQASAIAIWHGPADAGRWQFLTPNRGWLAWVSDEAEARIWDGTTWRPASALPDLLPELGIGTSPDETNRFAVSAPATLLTHDGADHRMVINKAGAADTASILFQSAWSGRAEMGLTGSDDFAFKVSADGAAWTTALTFDGETGAAGGAAVQQGPTDTNAGRLMRADWGYGPGNVLGPVAETAGVPTGAVIERGETPAGAFVRFADGTQICNGVVVLDGVEASRLSKTWVFPMRFAGGAPSFIGLTLDASAGSFQVTPALDELGILVQSDTTDAQTVVSQFRAAGGADFVAGDRVAIVTCAIGRWF